MLQSSNRQIKKIPVTDNFLIDSSAITDFIINGIDSTDYLIDPLKPVVKWKKYPKTDSVQVTYRKLNFNFNKHYQHKNRKLIDSNFVFSRLDFEKQQQSDRFINYKKLDMNGSYGRSISIGNNQDFVSNANFNLQANGYLPDSIKLEASLTDNTIPFQPEGNTANLQEFDLISIRLSKHKRSLQVGDYNLNKPNSYFLNYTKRVQGLFFETEEHIGKKIRNKSGLSASVAKGEFARNIFMGSEGNQGPYRLTGNNNEQLFVILAATEKVYVDNILQERGENADYIINYNTNEIRFMPRRPINQFSRIQVEFEYRTNYYLNSLVYAYNTLSIGDKWTFHINAYSNQDAKNQTFQQQLSPEQKQLLAAVGDSTHLALFPNISPDTFGASKILYRIRDTIVSGIRYDSIYEYTTDASQNLYNVGFSFTGKGQGDYILSGSNANGRVYQWVAPVGGIRQGDYSALSLLVSPKKHQVITLAGTYNIDSFKKISLELAGSDKDPNTFSLKNNNSHQGMASKFRYEEERHFGKTDSLRNSDWTMTTRVHHEYVQSNFRAIAPFREVEFGRDWNVPLSGNAPDEHWAGLNGMLRHRYGGTADYLLSYYNRGMDYMGLKKSIGYRIQNKHTNSGFQFSQMTAEDSLRKTILNKPKLFAEYTFHRFLPGTIGGDYSIENNKATAKYSDSLDNTAFYFDILSAYWRSTQAGKLSWNASYFRRRDHAISGSDFVPYTRSDNYSLQLGFDDKKNHNILFTGTYRQLHIDQTGIPTLKPEETLLGRLQYDGALWSRAFSWNQLYDFGTGQEQKRNFTYVQVPAGQGVYNWIDYNNDGVQQLNEFVTALYPDQKLFIRIFTPSDEYVKVNNVMLTQSVSFDPGNFFKSPDQNGWSRIFSKISDQLALQINNKIFHSEGIRSFNPFGNNYADSNILSVNQAINNTFYLNRNSPKWGFDYNFSNNKNTLLLSYGLNSNQSVQHLLKSRTALSKTLTAHLIWKEGFRNNTSGVNDGSSYIVRSRSLEPLFTWINKSSIRISSSVRYEERKNDILYGGEKAGIQSVNIDAKLSKTNTGIIQIRFTYSNIDYHSNNNNIAIDYIILDGLQKGSNFLWYTNWQRKLGKGIELLLEYEGRKAGNSAVINTGRMSIRAIL